MIRTLLLFLPIFTHRYAVLSQKNLKRKCVSGFYFQPKYTRPNPLPFCFSLFLPKQDARNRASCFDDLCFSILILPHALCHTPHKIKKFAYIEPFGYRTAIRCDRSFDEKMSLYTVIMLVFSYIQNTIHK